MSGSSGAALARHRRVGGQVLHTLHPGEVACAVQGERMETLLGSCVAIVLTDPRRTVGAMCHIVHAGASMAGAPRTGAYAEVALDAMQQLLIRRGIAPHLCEAYVYGGGNMFPTLVRNSHVGETNARWVLQALAAQRISVLAHDVGGTTYRRLGWTVGPAAPQISAVAV